MSHSLLLAIPVLLFGLPTGQAAGHHWQVLADGTGDAPTIQAAIDSAAAGDTVVVACGTYFEHDIEMRSGIALCSEARDPGCAVIDAQGQGRCLFCVGLDQETSVEGFTFTGGLAEGCGADCNGGAMYCRDSFHHVSHCAFVNNCAHCYGGGVYCQESSPVLTACVFHGNEDEHGNRGLHCDRSSSPRLKGCKFRAAPDTPEAKRCRGSRKHHGKHHGH